MIRTALTTAVSSDVSMLPVQLPYGFGQLHYRHAQESHAVGVLLCSAWGVDELSSRKMLFRLSSGLAAAGLPSMRFDYPGTADAIDWSTEGDFATWIAAANSAADQFKAIAGLEALVFAGLGIGSTVALLAAAQRNDVAATVLAAPVINGRRYLREIAMRAAVIEDGLGLDASQRSSGVSMGGIVMPPRVATNLRAVDVTQADLGAPRPTLVVERPEQPQDAGLADHLTGLGWSVGRAQFEGYEAAMANATISVLPQKTIQTITQWIVGTVPRFASAARLASPPLQVRADRPDCSEEPVTFGRGLFGVLTHPRRRKRRTIVVFLNAGYDYHAGWAYQWARTARMLAASGIASLRFDMANIGDSAANPQAPDQVLYSVSQSYDISAALDMLASRRENSVVLVGRCSGAYAAFHAAAGDARIASVVLINPLRFIWDPAENIDIMLQSGPRPLTTYRRRAFNVRTLRRLAAGDIDVRGAARSIGAVARRKLSQFAAPLLGSMSKVTRQRRQCYSMLKTIGDREAPVRIICSESDADLEQMAFYFGQDFGLLSKFKGVTMTIVPHADHNMTPEPAHQTVADAIRQAAMERL